MLHLVASLAIFVAGHPSLRTAQDLKAVVESASVFEPGLIYVTRKADLPKGSGRYRLTVVPEAVKGSFWYATDPGARIVQSLTRLKVVDRKEKVPLISPAQLLAGNVGKAVRFRVADGSNPRKIEALEGTLEYAGPPPSSEAGLRLKSGALRRFDLFDVTEVDLKGLSRLVQVETKVPERVIEFDVEAPNGGSLRVATLERGAGWGGSYALNMDQADTGTLAFKVQLVMGAMRFDGTDVRLLSGLPSLPEKAGLDPASGIGGLDNFLNKDAPIQRWNVETFDPFEQVAALLAQRQQVLFLKAFKYYRNRQTAGEYERGSVYAAGNTRGAFARGGGGFGGGEGLAAGTSIDFISYDSTDNSIVVNPGERAFDFASSGKEVADLYSYSLGKLQLEPGDRLTRQIYEGPVKPKNVIRWTGYLGTSGGVSSEEVGRYIEIENRSQFQWAPGPCMVIRNGTPLALTDMPFTAKGETAKVRVSKADDIFHEHAIKELARTPRGTNPETFHVDMEVTLTVRNPRAERLSFEVEYQFEGRMKKADGGEVGTVIPKLAPNPIQSVRWKFDLPAGGLKELKFQYELQT